MDEREPLNPKPLLHNRYVEGFVGAEGKAERGLEREERSPLRSLALHHTALRATCRGFRGLGFRGLGLRGLGFRV